MAVDLISLVGVAVIVLVILGVIGLGYQMYEDDKKDFPSDAKLRAIPPSALTVNPPMTGPPAPAGTTPTGLPHDPTVDYWDDPAINFPGAPTKPIPCGLTALCQNSCYCAYLFPYDPYGLAAFDNKTAAEMQETAIKVTL